MIQQPRPRGPTARAQLPSTAQAQACWFFFPLLMRSTQRWPRRQPHLLFFFPSRVGPPSSCWLLLPFQRGSHPRVDNLLLFPAPGIMLLAPALAMPCRLDRRPLLPSLTSRFTAHVVSWSTALVTQNSNLFSRQKRGDTPSAGSFSSHVKLFDTQPKHDKRRFISLVKGLAKISDKKRERSESKKVGKIEKKEK